MRITGIMLHFNIKVLPETETIGENKIIGH